MPRRHLSTVSLREGVVRPTAPLRVDREKGIIYGVKIIGQESANRRRYTKEAIKAALSLYEGRAINVDHPKKPTDSRSPYDRFGWLENVRLDDAGEAFGDLHILDPEDKLAIKLMNAAEKKPDLFGLSHNADGEGYTDAEGIFIIEAITEVRSVDLVSDPATTNGLFESRNMPKTVKKKAFLESAFKKWKGDPKLKTLWKRVLEMDTISPDAEMPVDDATADGDAEDKLKAGFKDAIMGLVDDALEGDTEALKKISDLIKSHAKVNPGETATEEEEDPEKKDEEEKVTEEEDEEKKDDEKKMESKLARLERKDRIRDLCEAADVKPTKALMESLLEAGSDKVVKLLIDQEKRLQTGTGKKGPRSQSPGTTAVTEGKIPEDPKALATWLQE